MRKPELPRDIIVKVTKHKMRDLILIKQFQELMEIAGKRVKIWKTAKGGDPTKKKL